MIRILTPGFLTMALLVPCYAGGNKGKTTENVLPIVAYLVGNGPEEVVIRPDLEKVKALGLKIEDLQSLRYQRIIEDKWDVKIYSQTFDLSKVAQLEKRKLHAPPFKVPLPDGREAIITPDPAQIGKYMVTGEFFEEKVRFALTGLFFDDPSKQYVLGGIRLAAHFGIPNFWEVQKGIRIHTSTGEPIAKFAKVELRGNKGPQAKDLEQMRKMRQLLESTVEGEKGVTRTVFERNFGAKSSPGLEGSGDRVFKVGDGYLAVWFSKDSEKIESIFASSGDEPQRGEPRDYGQEARHIAKTDRAFLLAFFQKKYREANAEEMATVRAILDRNATLLQLTADEKNALLKMNP